MQIDRHKKIPGMTGRYRHPWLRVALLVVVALGLQQCETDEPTSLFDPDTPPGPTPVISGIEPAGGALAGVGELVINGSNFSSTPTENFVFFDKSQAVVTAAAPTQLSVQTPNLISDSIRVKIGVFRVELFSDPVLYSLAPAVNPFGDLLDIGQDSVEAFGVAVDVDENVFVSLGGNAIKKIAPDGSTSLFTRSSFFRANAMRFGPGGTLYAVAAAGRVRKMSTFDASGAEATFTTFSAAPVDFDFDPAGNIWAAVADDIYLVRPDGSKEVADSYPSDLVAVRYFDGALYAVSGSASDPGTHAVWKSSVQGESLSARENFLDAGSAAWLDGSSVLALTFALDGEVYVGTDHPGGVFVLHPDGSTEVLYPGLLPPRITTVTWGTGNFLYAVQKQLRGVSLFKSQILKVDLAKPGAPYFGRT